MKESYFRGSCMTGLQLYENLTSPQLLSMDLFEAFVFGTIFRFSISILLTFL